MRLHSLIFASNLLVPSIGISYDPKVKSFMESISMPILDVDEIYDNEKVADLVRRVLDNRMEVTNRLRDTVKSFKEDTSSMMKLLRKEMGL